MPPYRHIRTLLRPLRLSLSRSSSTKPPHTDAPQTPSAFVRLQSRLPPRLRPYLNPLLSAPLSHITSFLVLHELTAIVPLGLIFGGLHYSNSAPGLFEYIHTSDYFTSDLRPWARYARRKGWVADGEVEGVMRESEAEQVAGDAPRVVVELAVAWAVTKVLLPVRLVASVWATPWFARVAVVPVSGIITRLARRHR